MSLAISEAQAEARAGFRAFVDREIVPVADRNHREERTPEALIQRMAALGWLGLTLPEARGGAGKDNVTLGLLCEEVGRGCSSLRSLLTVHDMVAHAVLRWGSAALRARLVPELAAGRVLGALALSEPNVGSDAKSIETKATRSGGEITLNGCKKWITYGEIAGVFLVVASSEEGAVAALVERDRPGVSIKPIHGMLGIRASMTAEVHLRDCRVPAENILARPGFGISHVAASALDRGRYTVAWGAVGITQACLEACVLYTGERRQFGALLKDHQLIRRAVTDMSTDVAAARLLCLEAGRLRDAGAPEAMAATARAKYFASRASTRAANDAVQLHGANGCGPDYPVQRYLGDARVLEIIEGSTQIQQITLAEHAYQEYNALRARLPGYGRSTDIAEDAGA